MNGSQILAEALERQGVDMFFFILGAPMLMVEAEALKRGLRGIDVRILAVAMKGASEPVSEMIHTNMSERNREILDDEIASTGPLRLSQVEEARAEVVRAIRTLEADGQITVTRGDEDAFVD